MNDNHRFSTDCTPPPIELDMTELLQETATLAHDVQRLAETLNFHMFGCPTESADKIQPNCMRDQMVSTRSTLMYTAQLLSEICNRVGASER